MKNFLESFKNATKGIVAQVITLVLAVLGLVFVIQDVPTSVNIWQWFALVLPAVLVALAALVSEYKGKTLAANTTLLFGFTYFGKVKELVDTVFGKGADFKILTLVLAFVVVYLLLQIVANLGEIKNASSSLLSGLGTTVLLAFAFFSLRDGKNAAIIVILPTFLSLLAGAKSGTILLLLAGVVAVPFGVINGLANNALGSLVLLDYIYIVLALALLVVGVMDLVKSFKNKE